MDKKIILKEKAAIWIEKGRVIKPYACHIWFFSQKNPEFVVVEKEER